MRAIVAAKVACSRFMKATTRADYEQRVLRAERFVEGRLDEEVAPAEVARVAGMSLHHFHRVYRGMRGESVMGYVRRIRLERAARQLRMASRSVLDVAIDAGYGSHEAFTRAFSQRFGVAPTEHRQGGPLVDRVVCAPAEPPDEVDVRWEDERRMMSCRHVGPWSEVPQLWARFAPWYAEHVGPPSEMFALVPDDPSVTPADRLRYDACLPTPPGRQPPASPFAITETAIPAGRYAVVVHRGSYESLSESYLALIGGWFPNSGHALAAEPVVERYLNSPEDHPPTDLLTEIWVRIEERGWVL